jgi:arginine decarboxylase
VEIARTGDYTVLVLFSVGTSKGKWGALLENLFEFKRLYDTEAPLKRRCRTGVEKYPQKYRNVTLKELSDEMHAAMVELRLVSAGRRGLRVEDAGGADAGADVSEAAAQRHGEGEVHGDGGAHCGVMLVPYPPGIPVCMPGERLGGSPDSPVIKLILALEEFGKRFPGFEREVHGIEVDAQRATTGCAR